MGGDDCSGVSNCYMFKSRLQEYAQKAPISTPVYETVKEGPSHEPIFKSTVIVNGVRYDSLPGFFNRKVAEQSAAEVALQELMKDSSTADYVPNPVHETWLCKNILQEYSQRRNYPIPNYVCKRVGTQNQSSFTCAVDIGGIQYIGGSARTKKEAEIKAARTALMAIRANNYKPHTNGHMHDGQQLYTVIPRPKKTKEMETPTTIVKALQKTKAKFKKKSSKKRISRLKRRKGVDFTQNGQVGEDVTVAQNLETSSIAEKASQVTQTSMMPNRAANQHVRSLRVVVQTTQGVLIPLMPGNLGKPPEQLEPVIQNQSPGKPSATNLIVEFEGASQERQPRQMQHGSWNSNANNHVGEESDSNIHLGGEVAGGTDCDAEDAQLNQSGEIASFVGMEESVDSL